MLKLRALILVSLLIVAVTVGCSSSDQNAIDKAVSATQTPVELFASLSPSIPFVETAIGTGSGILIDGGYVLTNYHVVSPFQSARIVFPNGSEFLDVPLIVGDSFADIAVLGPINIDLPIPPIANGEQLPIGSPVLLIGYPGEPEYFPQPTLSTGLISRMREWDVSGITYIQTDQAIAGGQSGGALVSSDGQIIGISGLSFSEVSFALNASIHDIMYRVEELMDIDNASEPTFRTFTFGQPPTRLDKFVLSDDWQLRTYLVEEPVGSQLDIVVSSSNDIGFDVVDSTGWYYAEVDEGETGSESASFVVDAIGPLFVEIYQFEPDQGTVEISCTCDLNLLTDIDDFKTLSVGDSSFGEIDFPGDMDAYTIFLNQGDSINVLVTSLLIDPFIYIGWLGMPYESAVTDDDSGGGLYGEDAMTSFVAPHSGEFRLLVQDSPATWAGGYMVVIEGS